MKSINSRQIKEDKEVKELIKAVQDAMRKHLEKYIGEPDSKKPDLFPPPVLFDHLYNDDDLFSSEPLFDRLYDDDILYPGDLFDHLFDDSLQIDDSGDDDK